MRATTFFFFTVLRLVMNYRSLWIKSEVPGYTQVSVGPSSSSKLYTHNPVNVSLSI